MICATCGEPVALDGPLGYVHENGSKYADEPFRHSATGIKATPEGVDPEFQRRFSEGWDRSEQH